MATIVPNYGRACARGVALLASLILTSCGSNVEEACAKQMDAATTALEVYKNVSTCLKDGVTDEAIRDNLKKRSERLLSDGKVGAFATAMPPEPDVVEGVQNNTRRYSIRSLVSAPDKKPRVLHLGFEFTDGKVSGIVFDLNERQDPDAKPTETVK
jgi:hypothetical protein